MIINPTKKALPLFNKLPQVTNKQWGRDFSDQNPFFSWYANYFTINRKKVVLLVNDATFMPIALAGIDADKKKQLEKIIPQAITEVFSAAGISQQQIQNYLMLAGMIEINGGYNRTVTGVVTNMISLLEHWRLDLSTVINTELSLRLADMIFKGNSPILNLKETFSQELIVQTAEEKTREEKDYVIERDWQSLADYKPRELSDEEIVEVEANNRLILNAFQMYLEQHDKLARKTVKRHVDNLNNYLNGYLLFYGYDQAVSNFEVIDEYFSWATRKMVLESETAVKRMGSSLKKFYQFLLLAGEVKKSDMPKIREAIEMGLESGEMTLLMMEEW